MNASLFARYFIIAAVSSILIQTGWLNAQEIQPEEQYRITRRALEKEYPKRYQFSKIPATVIQSQEDFDAVYYDLNLKITTQPQNLQGIVTGTFRSMVDGLSAVELNFDSREDIQPWQNFSVTGSVNSYSHQENILTVQLDRTYNAGETFSIAVQYSGVPRSSGFKGFDFDINKYGNVVISTLSEPYAARTWWPCKDDPADKADSVRIQVNVPQNLIVASNGLLVNKENHPDETTTYVWKSGYPITTYLVSLAISNYATFTDSFEYAPGKQMPVEYYVYPQKLSAAQAAFAPIVDMLHIYSDLFQLYPFINEKYGQAVFEWGGAMEHQTITSVGIVDLSWKYVYAHELAHHWFGDLVTCENWGDIWLNEGFATYSESLYEEQIHGREAYHTYMKRGLANKNSWAVEPVFRFDTGNPANIFRWTVYEKGAWVLHMLRKVLGDSVFFHILNTYPNDPQFAHGTATTAEFKEFCEQKSGQSLDWFFQQWIYEPYYPNYQWGYTHFEDDSGYGLNLKIQQVQKTVSPSYDHIYTMPVDFVVKYDNTTPDTFVVYDSLEVQSFTLRLKGPPAEVLFDPDNWILKTASQVPYTSIDSGNTQIIGYELHQNYPNPFNGETTITYEMVSNDEISLEIYDITGKQVKILETGFKSRGIYEVKWDGTTDEGRRAATGIYIYRLKGRNFDLSRKMLLIQ